MAGGSGGEQAPRPHSRRLLSRWSKEPRVKKPAKREVPKSAKFRKARTHSFNLCRA